MRGIVTLFPFDKTALEGASYHPHNPQARGVSVYRQEHLPFKGGSARMLMHEIVSSHQYSCMHNCDIVIPDSREGGNTTR